ncbi:MDR family MFS transporter [Enterococcus xiangfangensis]|uniref:MDR family MFS transporter n=1 Tax=Enterococcus xiangfangensis TaxID=1296537 RepID=UPI0010F68399|nr:MDR family MFS transporter [Enterococcus xiangfangensis]MBM7711148.1 EmrB/QacA subfamily drug resistance transporter [Enterococcus xiangfangensis]NBK07681.1 DHA2 family efflux MFS transporter permease subunit [Enterococcus asini]
MVPDKQRTLIFINILISCIASSMLATALTTALPTMVTDFHVSVTTGQWLTSGYALAMGIMMPLTAFLIVRFPTKKLYLFAIGLFILGLIACVLAPNFSVLMLGRILQACGNGILSSMAQVILLTIYPLEKRGSIMGWYGLSIGAAPVIAPTIAGILVDVSSWRMIFYAAIVIMAISLIFSFLVFDDVLENRKQKFDSLSFVLSGLAYGGITLGIGTIGTYSLVSYQTLLPLLIGFGAMIIFAKRQFHLAEPFLDLRVLQSNVFVISLIGSMLLYFLMMGSSIILPLYVQSIAGYSATISGLVTLPGSLAMTLISPFTGRFYDRFGIKKLFIIGAIALLFSNFGMVLITMKTSILIVAGLNVLRSIAIGCLMMPLVTWGMSDIKQSLTAHGTALLTSLRTIAGAIGSAVFVSIMTGVTKHSALSFGSNAQIHGLNVTFIFMSCSALVLVAFAFFSKTTAKVSAN